MYGPIPPDLTKILSSMELRTKYLMGYYDPVKFVQYFLDEKTYRFLCLEERIHPVTGQIVYGHPKQRQFLRQVCKEDVDWAIIKAGSRSGKTFILSLAFLWSLFYRARNKESKFYNDFENKPYICLNSAPSVDQACLVRDQITLLVGQSPFLQAIEFIFHNAGGQKPYFETFHGAKLLFRSTIQKGRFLLGYSIDFAATDECASEYELEHIRKKILSERTKDTLGKKLYVSTPQGEGATAGEGANEFRRMWAEAKQARKDGNKRIVLAHFTQYDNPTLVFNPEAYIYDQANMTSDQFREEKMGLFARYGDYFFNAAFIDKAYARGAELDLQLFIPRDNGGEPLPDSDSIGDMLYAPKARPSEVYVTGVDPAGSTGRDDTAIVTFQVVNNEFRLVALEVTGRATQDQLVERIKRRLIHYRGDLYFDATGNMGQWLGQSLDKDLDEDLRQYCHGINFAMKPGPGAKQNHKNAMLIYLANAIEKGKLVLPPHDKTKKLRQQLKFYKLEDKGLQTDLVFGCALALYAYKRKNIGFSLPTTYDINALDVSYAASPLA